MVSGKVFGSVWLVETLCRQHAGSVPQPLCLAGIDLVSGRAWEQWLYHDGGASGPPVFFGPDGVVVSFSVIPVALCFLAAGWQPPEYALDLSAEFRVLTNGLAPCEATRSGMLRYFGESVMAGVDVVALEELCRRGGGYTDAERDELLAYCRRRLSVTERLYDYMLPFFDGSRSLFRGDYLLAAAGVELAGVPVDAAALERLYADTPRVRRELVVRHGGSFPGVFVNGRFDAAGFRAWLGSRAAGWPRTPTGLLLTDDDTLKEMALLMPELEPLRQLKKLLHHLGSHRIAVGPDGRNRCPTRPFASITGRNQPSSSHWIFGAPKWLRRHIRPEPGRSLALIDYRSQEFAIGAALSGDPVMAAAYTSGDPYLAFAVGAGAAPAGATAETHPHVRALYKTAVISIMYGIGVDSLATRLGVGTGAAERIVRDFRGLYGVFHAWQQSVIEHAYLHGSIQTSLGWRLHVDRHTKPRTLGNFLLQATGADILRLAVILAAERRVTVCAMNHDAIMIECGEADVEGAVAAAEAAMQEASQLLLDGYCLRTDRRVADFCGCDDLLAL